MVSVKRIFREHPQLRNALVGRWWRPYFTVVGTKPFVTLRDGPGEGGMRSVLHSRFYYDSDRGNGAASLAGVGVIGSTRHYQQRGTGIDTRFGHVFIVNSLSRRWRVVCSTENI